jgi:Protein phosphatase 2C
MTTNAPPRDVRDHPVAWHVEVGSERGAAHLVSGLPNQDAVTAYLFGAHGVVAAVADGHGHHRHFRSDRGSRLAVTIGSHAAEELTTRLDQLGDADQITAATRDDLVPAIAERWREAVAEDLAAEPITEAEQAWQADGDDDVIAYGSTLLLALVWRQWLVLAQIGDGDIVCVRSDGGALLPVPGDPALDGLQTTSLCEPRAADAFRVAVVDMSRTELAGVMLATDGYGNAQLADPWTTAFSSDLVKLLREHDAEWLASQVPSWAARCASADGSADDTTIALLLAPVRNWPEHESAEPTAPVQVTAPRTEPMLIDPVVESSGPPADRDLIGWSDGTGPRRSPRTRWPQRIALLLAAVVLIAAALGGLALWRRSSAGSTVRPDHCAAGPTAANGTVVRGATITVCASTGRRVTISTAGLPADDAKLALQADGSLFVLAPPRLFWTPITATANARWQRVAVVASRAGRLCRAAGVVVADAMTAAGAPSSTGGPTGAAGSWVQLRVNPAVRPPVVAGRQRGGAPLCPARRSR